MNAVICVGVHQDIVVVLTLKTVQISAQHLNTLYINTGPTDAGDKVEI